MFPVSPSIPAYVPILVGVIGMIGVIAGSLINAWREDRRWIKEQEREELRWQRARDKDQAQREHEKNLHWLEKKYDLYSKVLVHSELIGSIYRNCEKSFGIRSIRRKWKEQSLEIHHETTQLIAELGLLGSTEAAIAGMDLLSFFRVMHTELEESDIDRFPEWEEFEEKRQELVLRESTFRSAAMQDLGLKGPLAGFGRGLTIEGGDQGETQIKSIPRETLESDADKFPWHFEDHLRQFEYRKGRLN